MKFFFSPALIKDLFPINATRHIILKVFFSRSNHLSSLFFSNDDDVGVVAHKIRDRSSLTQKHKKEVFPHVILGRFALHSMLVWFIPTFFHLFSRDVRALFISSSPVQYIPSRLVDRYTLFSASFTRRKLVPTGCLRFTSRAGMESLKKP